MCSEPFVGLAFNARPGDTANAEEHSDSFYSALGTSIAAG